ncbi:DNA polymerase III subunit gamma/tau [Sphingorhabdus sp.]|uniref:DNA polymerase III subunit gamma/tau n=1 Tax=Sphingorhabdus sp. TaxID=1902408 RepID=UPI003BAF196E
MPDDALGLGLVEPAIKPKAEASSPYRVLARKYRPQNFAELIGQDAMVQTLGNAIKRERLAHAFLMTGVRGVGKTSTARLIAKALNCTGPDGQGGPTIDPCGVCEACISIAEGRHIDVIEMDAASHTGVDDVREIIEAVRYAAVSARYKIYIIDEVHMLSKNAFNALLKTLEEPPAHVKFLFATTEVNKVPVTVLSRCQRFDLKRISADKLAAHFGEICLKEAVTAEPEALMLVAQAAEGSVRDGLSILDQAIAHADMAAGEGPAGGAQVSAAQVREMLGLSDRAAVRRILGLMLDGDAQSVLGETREQYVLGVEPLATLAGLLREVHLLTLAKLGAPHDASLPQEARDEVERRSDVLSFPQLHRLWQLMLKGHDEVSRASMPLEACEMALLRVMHAAQMPDPGELARMLKEGGVPSQASVAPVAVPTMGGEAPAAKEATFPTDFGALVDALDRGGHPNVAATLHDVVRLVSYAPPRLEFQFAGPVHQGFHADLNDALYRMTGTRWEIAETTGEAQPSLYEQELAARATEDSAILESPLVKAALEAFPEAMVEIDGRVLNVLNAAEVRSLSA